MSGEAGKGSDRRAYSVKTFYRRRKGIKWPGDKKKREGKKK